MTRRIVQLAGYVGVSMAAGNLHGITASVVATTCAIVVACTAFTDGLDRGRGEQP